MAIILKIKKYFSLKWFYSIRFRMAVLLLLFGMLPCLIMKTVLIKTYESNAVDLRTAEIQNQCTILCAGLGANSLEDGAQSDIFQSKISELANVYTGRVLVVSPEYKVISDSYDLDEGKTVVSSNVIDAFSGTAGSSYDPEEQVIEVAVPITPGTSNEVTGVLLMDSANDALYAYEEKLTSVANLLLWSIFAVILLLSIPSGILLSRPIRRMKLRIDELTEGHSTEELEIKNYTELQELSESFNKLYRRMKAIDSSRKDFVANVSHELKTPLTSLKILSDSLIYQQNVPEELYKEFLQDMSEEVDRENRIINDLLELVKMDQPSNALKIETVDINHMVESLLWRLKPIAKTKNIELVFESYRPVKAEVDETKLTLAIMNLAENAIKYNHDNGWVHVKLNADHRFFTLEIADSGIGIPKEDQEHIFERFYRVDKSHSREIGGTGLGLSISRGAIIMHRGSIQVFSQEGQGTTFIIKVPLVFAK